MRKTLLLPMALLLAGCADDSATYRIDGNDYSLTIRRQQRYFWSNEAELSLVARRLPDCLRLHTLTSAPLEDLSVELFAAGEGLWNVRAGKQLWQLETQTCNGLNELENDPKADLGQAVGVFSVKDGKLVFEAAQGAPAADGAAAEAPPAEALQPEAAPAPAQPQ
jgi:hypothetical protein